MRSARERDRLAAVIAAARRRRRERLARRAAAAAVVVLALWLVARSAAGAGAADYVAGLVSGGIAATAIPDALRRPVERLARRAGVSARTAAARPVPRAQRPARTPIHDTAEHAQKGT